MDESELLKLFWTEVREYLDGMNANVMSLEMSMMDDDAGNFVERLRELNRVAHSMKGAARAVGVKPVEQLGYHMEEIFDAALKRGLGLTPAVCDLLYDALDVVSTIADGETVADEVLEELTGQMEQVVANNQAPPDVVAYGSDADGEPLNPRESDTFQVVAAKANGEGPHIEPDAPPVSPPPPPPELDGVSADDIMATLESRQLPEGRSGPSATQTILMRSIEDTVRVDVGKLDRLMEDASELVVSRLQSEERKQQVLNLRQHHGRWTKEWRAVRASYIRLARRLQDEDASEELRDLLDFLETNQRYLNDALRELNHLNSALNNDNMRLMTLTDELQASISKLRLVPFETIAGAIQRTMRDAARETGKEAYLDIIGGSTEIDKTVLELLKDPIMHLVRNAVDHGIETPAEREKKGKPPAGWVYMNVEVRGSEILIYVGDDGGGINADKVRQAAVKAGVLTQAAAQGMEDHEAKALIFHPGLTTKGQVSAISGRGVGMDVVRSRVESLRGRVSVTSQVDKGTVTTISVPVSLTRIRSIVLRLGDEQYAVPSLSVQRMERTPLADIFMAEGRRMVKIGDRAMPVVPLDAMLGIRGQRETDADLVRLLVLNASDRQVAFEVDELLSERELVLKPLGTELAHTRYVSGAALLGSGEVILVLDANDLVRGATGAPIPARAASATSQPDEAASPAPARLRVLIADDSITTRTLEKNILETAGCDVRVAYDGQQAWEILAEQAFDVVISDIEMPRMDGLMLTRRIKGSSALRHLPVILLTSLGKPEHQEAGLAAGADAYLIKSQFDQDELLQAIQSVL